MPKLNAAERRLSSISSAYLKRRWKLAAFKAFAALEPVTTFVISRNIGEKVLAELLHQSFLRHPQDPTLGAKNLHEFPCRPLWGAL